MGMLRGRVEVGLWSEMDGVCDIGCGYEGEGVGWMGDGDIVDW